jgi:hypothetical protein
MSDATSVFRRCALVLGVLSASMAVLLMRSWFGPAQAFALWLGAAFTSRLILRAGVAMLWLRGTWKTRSPQALLPSILPRRRQRAYREAESLLGTLIAGMTALATLGDAREAASGAGLAVWGLRVAGGVWSAWAAADSVAEMLFHPRRQGERPWPTVQG